MAGWTICFDRNVAIARHRTAYNTGYHLLIELNIIGCYVPHVPYPKCDQCPVNMREVGSLSSIPHARLLLRVDMLLPNRNLLRQLLNPLHLLHNPGIMNFAINPPELKHSIEFSSNS
jgi:hypothetical protein